MSPTYDYTCDACGDKFEKFHSMKTRVKVCPKCGGRVRRMFGGGNFILKGGGWAKDSYSKTTPIIQEPGRAPRKVEHKSDFESRPK